MFDRQKIFNTGVAGIIAQNGFAYSVENGVGCMYRAPNGNKCLLGHSIPDADYEPTFEDQVPKVNNDDEASDESLKLAEILGATTKDDIAFLQSFQRVHDDCACNEDLVETFLDRSRQFAKSYGLEFPANV